MSEEELMLTHILKISRGALLSQRPHLTPAQQECLAAYKVRRAQGEPLQYILGTWEFYGLEFAVDPRVLVPRPETEILVDAALRLSAGHEFLDLGTGSGNIAVTLAKLKPNARITTVDRSAEALDVARTNARAHGVEERITWVAADMSIYLEASQGLYDLIISNPPYIPSHDLKNLPVDVRQEPAMALDGGPDGLGFFRTIIKSSPRLLRGGAYLMMEFGDGQTAHIQSLVEGAGAFTDIQIHRDLAGRERVVTCVRR